MKYICLRDYIIEPVKLPIKGCDVYYDIPKEVSCTLALQLSTRHDTESSRKENAELKMCL